MRYLNFEKLITNNNRKKEQEPKKNAMQSKQPSKLTQKKHMISLTNRHTTSTDKGKLVYPTLALNQTRESVKEIFSDSFFHLCYFDTLLFPRLLLTTSFLSTQKLYHHVVFSVLYFIFFYFRQQ
jgi:hypothetical protein